MTSILVVRHAEPRVDPGRPASTWALSVAGRAAALEIGASLAAYGPDIVVTSRERKARETGRIIAGALGLGLSEHEDLGEQGGDTVQFIADRALFRETVRRHFAEPALAVLGSESADAAAERFARAVANLHAGLPAPVLPVLVSHGRVMASFLASVTGADAWTIWNELTMPDALVVDPDAGTVRRIVP